MPGFPAQVLQIGAMGRGLRGDGNDENRWNQNVGRPVSPPPADLSRVAIGESLRQGPRGLSMRRFCHSASNECGRLPERGKRPLFCKPVKAGLQKASCRQRSAAVQRAHVLHVVRHDVGNEVFRRSAAVNLALKAATRKKK